MKAKTQFIASILVLVLVTAAGAARVATQHSHDHARDPSWKKGMVRLNTTAWIGDIRLKSGMYHVKHLVEGDKHWLVFKTVTLGAGYREGLMGGREEIARLQCSVEPAEKSIRNTKVILTRTSGGIRRIQETQIAGEKVRHILLPNG